MTERILLTGHSHQAWPDVAESGVLAAFADAADLVDQKWGRAFEKADRVRRGFATLLGDTDGDLALAGNTHDLLVRFLSALDLRRKQRIVSTDGEFHTVRRQLARLAEEGLEVVLIPALPASTVGERLAAAVDSRTAAVIVSAVFFETGHIAGSLSSALAAAEHHGAVVLIDAYHALNAIPFRLPDLGLSRAYVLGGGYKYCQLGEGNCFLRAPPDSTLRPVVTGWFAHFGGLEEPPGGRVGYATTAGARFAGATYDPTSHYRAAAVFDFFDQQGLTVDRLRATSQRQLQRLDQALEQADLPPRLLSRDRRVPIDTLGGFLALESTIAESIVLGSRELGVYTDHRGQRLRLGPAPYVTDSQLDAAAAHLIELVRSYPEG